MSIPSSEKSVSLVWQTSPGGPPCVVGAVALSADGDTVVAGTCLAASAGSGEGEAVVLGVYCYGGDGVLRWSDPITGWGGVRRVAVSADGGFAAAAGDYEAVPATGFVRAYDVATGQVLLDVRTAGPACGVAISDDGTWLVAGADGLELYCRVQGTEGYTRVATACAGEADGRRTVGVDISGDGSVIVFRDDAGRIGLLHNSGGALVVMKTAYLPEATPSAGIHLESNGEGFAVPVGEGNVWWYDRSTFLSEGLPSEVIPQVTGAPAVDSAGEGVSARGGDAMASGGRDYRLYYYSKSGDGFR